MTARYAAVMTDASFRPTSNGVVATTDGRVGRILLDRPKALNALNMAMIRGLSDALLAWRDDPRIHAVIVEGAGGRAFCAGGDIKAVRQAALDGDHHAIQQFFGSEYELNALIAAYPKPYIALVDGVCMGGGIGVSVHGAIRVATEAALFAMPETAIALFPDVGATYLLPRLPGRLGLYMGLTGARIAGADAVHAGLATHFVRREKLPALSEAIAADGAGAVAAFAGQLPPFSLAAARPALDRCFGEASVPAIMQALADEGDWGRATLAMLEAASPSALDWSFDIISAGANRTLRQCLAAELDLTARVTRHPDFLEGVRAMIVDKDRKPRWTERGNLPL